MKKRTKLLSIILTGILAVGSFTGCTTTTKPEPVPEGEPGTEQAANKKIGVVLSTLNNPFFVAMKDGAEKKAKELGYEVVVLDSQNDAAKERSNVEDLIQQGVASIIINPTDSDAVVNAITVANESNIKVVTVDRKANGGEVACHVASDNIKGGEMAAEFILEQLGGKGNLVELQGIPGASATRDRGQGFHNVVDGKDGVKVVASQAADFDRQKGLTVTENIIQATPEFDAIFAHNDEMALGAIKALKTANKNLIVVGFDGNDDAKAAVESGELSATIAQKPDLMGAVAIENAVKTIAGEEVQAEVPVQLELIKK